MVGLWLDAAVILGVVIINALLGFLQEGKAEKALDSIRNMLSAEARTVRSGETRLIPAEELVPGDVVLLESGDRIPADLRLVDVKNLRTEEAALTGESVPIDKTTDAVAEKATVGDREGMAFSGTLVSSGRGTGVVVATGSDTELGRINQLMAGGERARHAAAAPDQEVRIRDHRRDRRGQRDRVRLRQMGPGDGFRGHLSGGRQHRGVRDPGRIASADHRHSGDRRAAHGAAQRHHPAAAGGGNLGLGIADLLRQDGDADSDGDDGGVGRHRQFDVPGHRRRLRTRRRGGEGRGAGRGGPGSQADGARLDALQRRRNPSGRRGLESGRRPDRRGALPVRQQARPRPASRADRLSQDRRDPVRIGTPVHGDTAQRRCRQAVYPGQRGARGNPRSLRSAGDDGGQAAPIDRDHFERASDALAAQGERVLALAWLEDPESKPGISARRISRRTWFCSASSGCSIRRGRRR